MIVLILYSTDSLAQDLLLENQNEVHTSHEYNLTNTASSNRQNIKQIKYKNRYILRSYATIASVIE